MKNTAKFLSSLFVITLMAFVAKIAHNEEIIFPEAFALVAGGLYSPRQVWNVSKPRFIILMSIGGFVGYFLSAVSTLYLPLKILIALIIGAFLLLVSGTGIYPVVSSMVLPVLMNTKSLLYPISVVAITLAVVLFQILFEKAKITEKRKYEKTNFFAKNDLPKWAVIIISVLVVGTAGINLGAKFLIAPPLIVGFCELMFGEKKSTKALARMYLFTIFGALLGGVASYFMLAKFELDAVIVTLIIGVIMLAIGGAFKIYFPPAYALSILPTIINENMRLIYPVLIGIGFAIFIIISVLSAKINNKKMVK